MANPWDNDPDVPAGISATPLPRNPAVVQQEEEEDARKNRGEGYDRKDRAFDNAAKFRNEFRMLPSVAEYNVALGTYNSSMKTKPNAQGDQSLITAYAKMLDPTSAVREGEFETTANTQKFIDQLKARFAKEFGEGGMLTDGGRQAIREEMRNLVVNRFKTPYERDRQQYSRFAQMEGLDPYLIVGEDAAATFPKGLLDPIEAPQNTLTAAGGGATDKAVQIPKEYQEAHYAYLRQNWGKIDPQDYTAFRSRLDERFGLNPNPEAYTGAVAGFNEMAALGGTPGQLGAVPNPSEEMGAIEQGLNDVASSGPGAFMANFGNSLAAGIPARVSGNQDKLEAIQDINPGASFAGDMAGTAAGALGFGGGAAKAAQILGAPRAATLAANPIASDAAFGTIYGATQDDDTSRGALTGLVSAIGGNVVGKKMASAFPSMFAPGAVRSADNSVPTIDQLKAKAGEQYQAAEAAGEMAMPDATTALQEQMQSLLAREGRITPKGNLIDTDTPITRAHQLVSDFAGEQMTPTQAGSVRKVMGEGLMAKEPEQRRLSGMMLDNFDEWAEPALPGIDEARETASRYLQGEQIAGAREIADANSHWYSQSGPENALRSAFRDLDRSTIRGKRRFDGNVSSAIEKTSRGTPFGNTMRGLGKFAPTGVIPVMGGLGMGSMAALGGTPTIGGLVAAGTMAGGAAARALATQQTKRNAEMAELLARGGPEYQAALDEAIQLATRRGGSFGAGLFANQASQRTRETTAPANR